MSRDGYRIPINGDWTLADLYQLPHTYSQIYAFLYSLTHDVDPEWRERIFQAYPWRGGYSAVNFYNELGRLVPKDERPRLRSIRYGSPGWLDLSLKVSVALAIRKMVSMFVATADEVNALYTNIYKEMRERKLMQIEVKREELKLRREQLQFIEESLASMSRLLGFSDLQKLQSVSPNPLASLRILLSLYRRVRTLAEYDETGKAKLSDQNPD